MERIAGMTGGESVRQRRTFSIEQKNKEYRISKEKKLYFAKATKGKKARSGERIACRWDAENTKF